MRLNKQIAELERLLSEREEALQQVIRVSETEKNKILELESELSRSLSLQSSEKENFENVQLSLTKQVFIDLPYILVGKLFIIFENYDLVITV